MDKKELYQNHGNHIVAIMPTSEFMQNHLHPVIKNSKVFKRIRTEVFADELDNQLTDVVSLKSGDDSMCMLTLLAYSPKSDTNLFISMYPELTGKIVRATIKEVFEWDNQLEATIVCCVGDFEFAFFPTDYYANKKSYFVGDTLSLEMSALGCKVEEAERGFSLEGQQAVDWLAKLGEKPTFDENGNVEPVCFNTEKLVAYINHDSKCPDEGEFQSPATDIESTSLLGVDFYKSSITIHKDEDDEGNIVELPLYFRKDFVPNIKEKDPIRGWLWIIGKMAENSD